MATNRLADSGDILFAATGAVASGSPQIVGPAGEEVVVILKKAGVSGDSVPAWTQGRFSVTKATDADWAVGERVYFDTGDVDFTSIATTNVYAGRAYAAAATLTATGTIDLNFSDR